MQIPFFRMRSEKSGESKNAFLWRCCRLVVRSTCDSVTVYMFWLADGSLELILERLSTVGNSNDLMLEEVEAKCQGREQNNYSIRKDNACAVQWY